ncbi:MAG: class I SAM-dependent rRNA methyltransferase, partial [Clostridia bacterium]|nr:class I SAM-dependent rRNA methyltransferase [Clostridia bacterium]
SLCTVRAHDGRYLGKGYINHLSKILVRIFITNNDVDDEALFFNRIKYADEMRKNYLSENCYRVVFAESDYLPGLIVDRFNDVLSVQILTLGMELKKQTIIKCLVDYFNPRAIVERSDSAVRKKEGLAPFKGVIYGEDVTCTQIIENGLTLNVDLLNGQKTGYFLDQKLNRLSIRPYCKDKTVLDCFCNAGGFALNASKAGAKKVYALDISKQALEQVNLNASLNGLTNIETVECDIFEKLREYKKEGKTFDLIVLDPPAFCKSANEIKSAYKGYKDINIIAMKLINKGGILVSSSCTHFMSQQLFKKMLSESAAEAGKRVKLLEERIQCLDHLPFYLLKKQVILSFA